MGSPFKNHYFVRTAHKTMDNCHAWIFIQDNPSLLNIQSRANCVLKNNYDSGFPLKKAKKTYYDRFWFNITFTDKKCLFPLLLGGSSS